MPECTIKVNENGPYVISGSFTLVDRNGQEYHRDTDVIALCRCGQSANKPFCDGTHKACGFVGPSDAAGMTIEEAKS